VSFDCVVEITSVFPSPLGGSVFKGIPLGSKSAISFRAARWVISRDPATGEYWRVQGDELQSKKHGLVIIVKNAFVNAMPSFKYVGKLLTKHPVFRGFYFGKTKVELLLKEVGDYALVTLLNKGDYLAIADAGLNESIAKKVCDVWGTLKEETDVATFLSENNFDSELAKKIVRLCKFNTIERLKRNPYTLVSLSQTKRAALKNISVVATKLGVDIDDERALIGCVEFTLYQAMAKGHTIVEVENLKEMLAKNLKYMGCKKNSDDAIVTALKAKLVCIYEDEKHKYLQLISVAYIEQYVETKLVELHQIPIQKSLFEIRGDGLKERIRQYNKDHHQKYGYALTNQQCRAVYMTLTNRVSVLSGFGGTGKTTVLKAIVELSDELAVSVHVGALAGKAANRARQSIGREAHTIHTIINNLKMGKGHIDVDSDPLIIIDETSMLDISLMCLLFKMFKNKTLRLLFVGDTAQLPPIGFGLFWHKLIESDVPYTKLTKVHRQLEGSPLHQSAMMIRSGKMHSLPRYQGQGSGVFILNVDNNYTQTILQLRKQLDCMVLTTYANRKYDSSTGKLNPLVQSVINRLDDDALEMTYGTVTIKPNDPVLATKNNHALGIFNGMTGLVVSVELIDEKYYCNVKFDDRSEVLKLSRDECWDIGLQLAYLLTIHKSQGSEYDICVILLGSPMLERSALYTALTRTKKLCIVVGTIEQYNAAIAREPSYKLINSGFNPIFGEASLRKKAS
jgi:exodeoxyribonuclease V alpha subunit